MGDAALTIAEALELTAGRTFFTCFHASDARRKYDDMCEVCWDCRSVRGQSDFDKRWPAVTRIQLPSRQMLSMDGRSVAHDWKVNPLSPRELTPQALSP